MNLLALALLIFQIESGGRLNPPDGDGGKAVGPLQIHRVMVDECNRLNGTTGTARAFTYADRKDLKKSLSMCVTFLKRQRERRPDATRAELMMSWQSGSITRHCTEDYRKKVKQALNTK